MSLLLDSRLRGSDGLCCIYRDHSRSTSQSHSRESGNLGGCACRRFWTPAYAGVTIYVFAVPPFGKGGLGGIFQGGEERLGISGLRHKLLQCCHKYPFADGFGEVGSATGIQTALLIFF